jgi:hypothetical protein
VRFPAGVKIAFLPTDVMPFDTALAVDTHGNAWGWGFNSLGQLCLRNGKEYATPVELPLSGVTALAGAGDHALYDSKGHVFACGNNANGDLGDGNHKATARPVPVKGLQRVEVSALVAAFNNSAVLLANGTYEDWGYDGQGQLGDGAIGVSSDVPVTVALSGPVTQVTQGGSYSDNGQTLAMLADGALYSWGDDEWGQLGDDERSDTDRVRSSIWGHLRRAGFRRINVLYAEHDPPGVRLGRWRRWADRQREHEQGPIGAGAGPGRPEVALGDRDRRGDGLMAGGGVSGRRSQRP